MKLKAQRTIANSGKPQPKVKPSNAGHRSRPLLQPELLDCNGSTDEFGYRAAWTYPR
jgi:hypothetical protein